MGGSRRTEQRQDNTVDAWTRSQIEGGQARARGIMDANPYQEYGGEMVAGLNDNQLAARDMFTQNMGAGNGLLDQAATAARQAGGYAPETITARSFADADLSAYQNPYQQGVIDAAANDINRQRELALNDNKARAARSGAFGGSRHGVIDAETNRAASDALARTSAQLRSDGFNQAAALYNTDANRAMQADMANNQFGLSAAGLGLQGAGLLGQLGNYQNQNARADAGLLGAFGSEQNALDTAALQARYGEFLRGQDDPFRRAQMELAATGLTPTIVDSSGTTRQRQNPGLLGIAGTGLQAASLFMSDRRLKADITPVGEHKGRKWYEFRYIWDKPSVRRLGLMAQDLLKTEPERVHVTDSGYYAVNYAGVF